jgi:hypothetical protein
VNGKQVCADGTTGNPLPPKSSSDTNTETTTTDNGDGTTTTTTTTTTNTTGADGSKGTTTTTNTKTCDAAGNCEESTTTESEGAAVEEDGPSTFCEENPDSPMCKQSSWAGTCAASFTCDGDAVQCAMAREQHIRNCQILEDAPSSHPAVIAANAGSQPNDHPNKTGETINVGSGFDQTDIVGGSCPSDQTFQVASGYPLVTIPFSDLCGPAAILGNILVGITALCCLGIVFVKGD